MPFLNIFLSQLLICCFYCIDFCIARPIWFVVGLALNVYDDDDDADECKLFVTVCLLGASRKRAE